MRGEKVSELTTNKLSVYIRCLNELGRAGETSVSSGRLAREFHLNSAQIWKDLANFGEFGVRGVGYYLETPWDHLTKIVGLDRKHRGGIIGAGRLGMALTDYYDFRKANFTVAALFGMDAGKIGKKVGEVEILDIKSFPAAVGSYRIGVVVIAVPTGNAQTALEMVVSAWIEAVLIFAPVNLKTDADVKIKVIDLTTSHGSLSYFLARRQSWNWIAEADVIIIQ